VTKGLEISILEGKKISLYLPLSFKEGGTALCSQLIRKLIYYTSNLPSLPAPQNCVGWKEGK